MVGVAHQVGQRLAKPGSEMTPRVWKTLIAHRLLPFRLDWTWNPALLKASQAQNGEECLVKIAPRGPLSAPFEQLISPELNAPFLLRLQRSRIDMGRFGVDLLDL